MPRRKKQSASAALIIASWQTVVAIGTAVSLAVVAYYQWAAKLTNPKQRYAAQLSPIGLALLLMAISAIAAPPEQPERTYARSGDRTDVIEPVASEPVSEPEIIVESEDEVVEEVAPEPYVESEPEPAYVYVAPEPVSTGSGYIAGSCKELKARGLGPFYPGDANYTSKRDRDKDGIACE